MKSKTRRISIIALEEKREKLQKKIEKINLDIEDINEAIREHEGTSTENTKSKTKLKRTKFPLDNIDLTKYDPTWEWFTKLVHFQQLVNRFYTSREAQIYIKRQELDLSDKTIQSGVSATLSTKSDPDGLIMGYDVPDKHARIFGSPKWFNEDGTPKSEYMREN